MKPFNTYQYVEGVPMTKRDELEVGSKFWNKGKWDTFVAPLLPTPINSDMIFVDVGCNAGIFLEQAEKLGFGHVIGVDSDPGAVQRANDYRDRIGGKYEIILSKMEEVMDILPASDVIVLANTHYYFTPEEWDRFLDKLERKANNVIIVTAEKKPNKKFAGSSVAEVRDYFKTWQETGFIDFYTEDDPHPRKLYGLAFKNTTMDRVSIDELDNGNNQQRGFLSELDEGKDPLETNYYRRLKSYRRRTTSKQRVWSHDELISYMYDRQDVYNSIKDKGMLEPIEAKKKNMRVVDGNHRHFIWKHLGYESILTRWTK